ncbi:hypothetical protein A8F94_05465 [Bacillus sp. FJAT-27225]|uniref:recombinase family protein n=1 Tax=Bacillus sp. FJAT-27225 TaxID=1743144 RepID=UPI00080C2770|nr:recombinase family protein [Bacillus sp. FJAT-27225]OCA91309.1 hypothetical protein A8F94_05465 [Bacillus sp. FJAT-27225]
MNLAEFLKQENLKGVFYGRHSTKGQKVETQRHVCFEFAKKHGITMVDEYIDKKSAFKKKNMDNRTDLQRLRKDAKDRKFDCVIVYKADRLARKIDQHMILWGEFRELGIPIILAESEKLYTTDSPTEIMVEIGLSSMESENTRIRTSDTYKSNTAKGKWQGGNLPYGYRYVLDDEEKSIMVQIPLQIKNVKQIFSLYRRGYGFKRIASLMNEGYPKHPEKGSGKWVAGNIKAIITNPYYAGYTTSHRIVPGSGNSIQERSEWTKGKCDAINPAISEEVWDACMEIYEKKKSREVMKNKYISPYLFIDILFCKDCDSKVKGKNYTSGKDSKDSRPNRRMYICTSCKQKWRASIVDEELFEQIMSGWHYNYHTIPKDDLQKNIMEKIQGKIEEIDKSVSSYKAELVLCLDELKQVESKQLELIQKLSEPDELQHALVQYRITVNKKIALLEDEIEKELREKQQLYFSYGDVGNFKEITKELTSFEYELDQPEIRKLFLFLLNKISIRTISEKSNEYAYDIIANVDLNQRGLIQLGDLQ